MKKMVVYKGKKVTVSEASKLSGIAHSTIRNRIAKGLSTKEIFCTKNLFSLKIFEGKNRTQIAKELGLTVSALTRRIERGMSVEQALTMPRQRRKSEK